MIMDKEESPDLISGAEKIEENLDLTGLLLEYLGNWKWFVLSMAICVVVAYFYIATIVPIYQVSASIYLSSDNSVTNPNVVSMSQNPLINAKDYVDETEIEILKSRNSLVRIVDSLGLSYSYFELGKFRDLPVYGTNAVVASLDSVSLRNLTSPITIIAEKNDGGFMFSIKTYYGGSTDEKRIVAKKLPVNVELSQGTLTLSESKITSKFTGVQKIVIKNPSLVASRIAESLNIQYAPNSGTILRITFRTPVIREGVDVINALIAFYNDDIIENKNQSAMQTEAFILDRLVMISGELKDVEQRLEDYRRANNIIDIDAQTAMNFSKKSSAEDELADVGAQQEILNSVEKAISRQDDYTPIAQVVESAELSGQIEAYNRKLAQRERLLQSSTEDNPMVQSMQEDLMRQKSMIMQGLRAAKNNLSVRRSNIAAVGSKSAGQLASLPPIDRGLQEIFREQQVKVNIYTFLLQKREEIALQKTLATPTARLIDNPTGSGPVYPQASYIYGLAAIIGLLLPALIIFLRRLVFPMFKDKEDLERVTSVTVLSEICKVPSGEKLVVTAKNNAPEAEMFRLLRNNIQFVMGKNKKVVLVTSSLSGEGKTFIATNIALSFALTGKKALAIGMDIRRPALAHVFDLNNRYGLTTYLCGQTDDLNSLIFPSGVNDNLWVMPAGPIPPNPNELLLDERLDECISSLRNQYDYIIIDSAPIGLVSDSLLAARVSDAQIYVVRANYSTRRCLKMMRTAIDTGRFPSAYLILNGVDIKSNAYRYRRYGAYGVYGAKKGYGYGYAEAPLPTSHLKRIWRKARKKRH